jgi:ribosomal protein L7/L12
MKVRITNRPHKLIASIKSVRQAAGLSLAEAKNAVDRSEWFEIKHAPPHEILEDLREAGAVVECGAEGVIK